MIRERKASRFSSSDAPDTGNNANHVHVNRQQAAISSNISSPKLLINKIVLVLTTRTLLNYLNSQVTISRKQVTVG